MDKATPANKNVKRINIIFNYFLNIFVLLFKKFLLRINKFNF